MKTFWRYFFYFIVFAFLGWVFEVCLFYYKYSYFRNSGTMLGPWLPIYGFGAIVMYYLSIKVKRNPIVLFITSFFVAGIIEYATSFYLEKVYGMSWWDYSSFPLNLNGRVYLYGLLGFAAAGLVGVYLIIPLLDKVINKYGKHLVKVLYVLLIIFLIDFIYCTFSPNTEDAVKLESNNNYDVEGILI